MVAKIRDIDAVHRNLQCSVHINVQLIKPIVNLSSNIRFEIKN